MKLNKDGQLVVFYRWTYGKTKNELPNLCPYFWKLLLAFLVFPITWLSFPWGFCSSGGEFDKAWNYEEKTFMFIKRITTGVVGYICLTLLARFINNLLVSAEFRLNLLIVIGIIIGAIILIAIIFTLGSIVCYSCGKLINLESVNEISDIIKERKEGFIDNYCPKIEWFSKDDE